MAPTSLLDLPAELVVDRIFSYLSLTNNEAIRLSLVSKEFFILLQNRSALISIGSYAHELYKKELRYMYSTLARYQEENIHLETLKLDIKGNSIAVLLADDDHHDIDGCIDLAAKKGLANLYLSMRGLVYVLPEAVFGIQSLEQLRLKHCCLNPERIVAWPNLRELSLDSVRLSDEVVFENVIKGCPSVETLSIWECFGKKLFKFKVSNLPNLRKLDAFLSFHQIIEVCESAATNLESVNCTGAMNLGEHEYPNLQRLVVHSNDQLVGDLSIKFPRLEDLKIISTSMSCINLSSPSLKKICIDGDLWNTLKEACFDVPNIVCFEYRKYGNSGILPKLLFKGKSVLDEGWMSHIDIKCRDDIHCSWLLKQKQFFAQLGMPIQASIDVTLPEEVFLDKDHWMAARSRSFPPVGIITGIREFTVRLERWRKFSLSFVRPILDAIFWIYRPQIIKFCDNSRCNSSYPVHDVECFWDATNSPTSTCEDILNLLKPREKDSRCVAVFNIRYYEK